MSTRAHTRRSPRGQYGTHGAAKSADGIHLSLRENFSCRVVLLSPLPPVSSSSLVPVLPAWSIEGNELWLAYPSRKLNSPALMSYIDFAMQFDEVKRYYVGE